MTRTEAQTLREAANAAVRRYSRMTRAQMRAENEAAQDAAKVWHLDGGPVTKDELVADTLELRGYGAKRLAEAGHVVGHDVVWPDCQWCQAATVSVVTCQLCAYLLHGGSVSDYPSCRDNSACAGAPSRTSCPCAS